ncbi:glycosyltransferase family 4 protein [Mobilicoccus pelagius]|uniref:D-inositol 3-phosphate glycosyltransferase n=1 Tax=Mobilicoccus pelagius NBRC 104925 TaxID=1089455 RepID=H5UMV2_9MICO|nr:glycosyltransferase family 4 protein [Mobilicoccus pelagius]GAB47060.1 putative glycosyltransferase [Mobilicoccus pelagius NBRC 104925]
MRIGVLTQWYDPEPGPAALPGVLARGLLARGHEVRVLTGFPNYPSGELAEGWRMSRRRRRVEDGVDVTRVALYPSHDGRAWRRMTNYGSFGASALVNGASSFRGLDAMWVNYSPITVAAPMLAARHVLGVPAVCHVADLWPDTLTAGGFAPRPSPLVRTVEATLEAWCGAMYAASEVVTYIAPGVGDELARRGVPRHKLAYAPMWAEESTFFPADDALRREGETWRASLGVDPDDVVLLYAGAIGHAQGLETLVEAAARYAASPSAGAPRLRVVVVGSGVAEADLRARAEKAGLVPDAVSFPGRVPQDRMPVLMAGADACFVGLAATPLSRITMPSKTQASLAAAKALVVAADGDVQDVARESGAGWAVDSGDVAALTGVLAAVCQSGRGGLADRGRRGRAYYEEHFGLDRALDRAEAHLETARAGRATRTTRTTRRITRRTTATPMTSTSTAHTRRTR